MKEVPTQQSFNLLDNSTIYTSNSPKKKKVSYFQMFHTPLPSEVHTPKVVADTRYTVTLCWFKHPTNMQPPLNDKANSLFKTLSSVASSSYFMDSLSALHSDGNNLNNNNTFHSCIEPDSFIHRSKVTFTSSLPTRPIFFNTIHPNSTMEWIWTDVVRV